MVLNPCLSKTVAKYLLKSTQNSGLHQVAFQLSVSVANSKHFQLGVPESACQSALRAGISAKARSQHYGESCHALPQPLTKCTHPMSVKDSAMQICIAVRMAKGNATQSKRTLGFWLQMCKLLVFG